MKKILFIFTGGTIGSTEKEGFVCKDEAKPYVLLEGYKTRFGELPQYDVVSPYTILSENLDGKNITRLISVLKESRGYDGVIITHGTDTLQYTSAALGYALGNNCVPTCVVSANYPLEDCRSNGFENLRGAVKFIETVGERGVWVSYKNTDEPLKIYRGTRLFSHLPFSHRLNGEFYGFFNDDGCFVKNQNYFEHSDEMPPIDVSLSPNAVSVLKITPYPGMVYPEISDNVKYIIHETYHSGTLNTSSKNALSFFNKMKNKGVKVFVTGVGNDAPYESTKLFDDFGLLPFPNISPVSAFMKIWMLESSNRDVLTAFLPLGGDI